MYICCGAYCNPTEKDMCVELNNESNNFRLL